MAPKALGSWRGVPFFTVQHDRSSGRRQPTYAIPFVDGAVSIDMGRQPLEISITAVFVGANYRNQRDALIEALEQPGSGLLVHPEYGRLTCVVSDRYRCSESTDELQQAKVSFTLVQVLGEQVQRAKDPAAATSKAAIVTRQLAADVAEKSMPWPAVSDFVQAARLAAVDKVIADLTRINNAVAAVLSVPSTYAAQLRSLANQTASLLSTPNKIVSAIGDAVDAIVFATTRVMGAADSNEYAVTEVTALTGALTSEGARSQAVEQFAQLGESTPRAANIDTVERTAQREERAAILASTQAMGLCTVAANLDQYRYDSARSGAAFRDQLVDRLLALSDRDDIDPALSDGLRDTASAVLNYFRTAVLRDIATYEVKATLPVEVIAYQLYQDAEAADDIIARNNIPDPSMVMPQTLEVLA